MSESPDARSGDEPSLVTIRIRRSTLFVLIAVMAGFVAGFWVSRVVVPPARIVVPGNASLSNVSTPAPTKIDVDIARHPAKGPSNAKVTLVEFIDFQCPFCKKFFDTIRPQIASTYGDKVRWVAVNFPISIHPFAQKAAEAAECADRQGSFWLFHDYVYKHQSDLSVPALKKDARAVHLDGHTFDRCLDSGAAKKKVASDIAQGTDYGVTGTPTFFINGYRYPGVTPWAVFKQHIDDALAASR